MQSIRLYATIGLTAFFQMISESAFAQCTARWLPGPPVRGTDGPVTAIAPWPKPGQTSATRFVLCGSFSLAGSVVANNIASYDIETRAWAALGSGLTGTGGLGGSAVAVMPNSDLIVGGSFLNAGGVPAQNCARWNGSGWTALNSFSPIRAIAIRNGEIFAGGDAAVRRWDGFSWVQVPTGGSGAPVRSMTVASNGDLIANASGMRKWDGSSWTTLVPPISGSAFALRTLSNGQLLAGGTLTLGGVSQNAARWNGSSWVGMGSGLNSPVLALTEASNGTLFAGVDQNGGIKRWTGTSWTSSDFSGDSIWALCALPNDSLVAGGWYSRLFPDGTRAENIAIKKGDVWSAIGSQLPSTDVPNALTILPNGHLLSAGRFVSSTGDPSDSLSVWNGNTWKAFGQGMQTGTFALAALPNGNVIAGGTFLRSENVPANYLACWNGTSWSGLGSGVDGYVGALHVMPNGDLIAGGGFELAGGQSARFIAKWDGQTWSPLGSYPGTEVSALTHLPNGDLVVGCSEGVHRWNGFGWSLLGNGPNGPVRSLAVLPNGTLVVGGGTFSFGATSTRGIASWDGVSWSALGAGLNYSLNPDFTGVWGLAVLPNGDLVATGPFDSAGGNPANFVARWRGTFPSGWSALGTGVDTPPSCVAALPNGDFVLGGPITTAGGKVSLKFAHWTDSGRLWVSVEPETQSSPSGNSATFTSTPSHGYENVIAQWELETYSASGEYLQLFNGMVLSSSNTVVSITQPSASIESGPSTLVLSNLTSKLNNRRVRVIFSNSCGSIASQSSACYLYIAGGCPADLNHDGVVDDSDFSLFVVAYDLLDCVDPAMSANCPADFNGDTYVNDADFLIFVEAYNILLCH